MSLQTAGKISVQFGFEQLYGSWPARKAFPLRLSLGHSVFRQVGVTACRRITSASVIPQQD